LSSVVRPGEPPPAPLVLEELLVLELEDVEEALDEALALEEVEVDVLALEATELDAVELDATELDAPPFPLDDACWDPLLEHAPIAAMAMGISV